MSHESLNNLRLFLSILWHVFLYLLNQRMAIYHREGQLRIFYLVRSVPGPKSAFLWKTAVILIDEIQRCPKQSGGSPTAAHRRGASVLSLFPAKKGARPENTRGKKSRFSVQKGQKSSISLQAVGKWRKSFSTCRRKQYLLSFLVPSRCIQLQRHRLTETGQNNELIILL